MTEERLYNLTYDQVLEVFVEVCVCGSCHNLMMK